MRNPARINIICKKLAELWYNYPDERLGQFFMNHIFNDGKDPFFREDSREKWMDEDYQTWEDLIDKQLEERKLFNRVYEETSYKQDYEKWLDADLKWLKQAITFYDEDKCEFVTKSKKPEPKAPNWKDYVKRLK